MAINTSRIVKSDIFLDFFYGVIRAYCRTFRIRVINDAPWRDYLQKGGSLLFCCWHQQVFPTLAYIRKFRELSPPLMISLSNDGDIGAGIVRRAGWTPVRGSSSKGGLKALKQMIRELRRSRMAGHIVDGPRGPAGIVKPGDDLPGPGCPRRDRSCFDFSGQGLVLQQLGPVHAAQTLCRNPDRFRGNDSSERHCRENRCGSLAASSGIRDAARPDPALMASQRY